MSLVDSLPIVHQNDVGTLFRITVTEKVWNAATECWDTAVDISDATSTEILFLLPSGKVKVRPAAFSSDGTDGKIEYTTTAGDIDEAGGARRPWSFSGWIGRPAAEHTTLSHQFRVDAGIPRPTVLVTPPITSAAMAMAPAVGIVVA